MVKAASLLHSCVPFDYAFVILEAKFNLREIIVQNLHSLQALTIEMCLE